MKIKNECMGCKNFFPSRMIGSGPDGEWVHPECRLGFSVKDGSEKCKSQEYKDE